MGRMVFYSKVVGAGIMTMIMTMPVKLPTPVLCTIASEATDGVGRFMAGPCGQV